MIEKLQIYKDTYLLTTKIYTAVPHMERMHKHIIGVKMINTSMELFTHITLANKSKEDRLKHLDNFLTTFDMKNHNTYAIRRILMDSVSWKW